MMWPVKDMPFVVFMDKRTEDLTIKPDIIAMWEYLPFRDGAFKSIIFDPPHLVRSTGYTNKMSIIKNYGCWTRKKEIAPTLFKAIKEFARVGGILCFKWNENRDVPTLWQLYSVFKGFWREIHRVSYRTKGSGYIRGTTWWVTFVKS